ncbi:DUF4489 domain-containing protein [Chengkuizengella axinellae]|uniref:DUF4489 domain-containing protein n=1 Tax=Chengkuizengella axinellae TaxID=3064388 RepID=A0ABT9J6U0_9BACL|nr:DUF4489 domain-containing protein [Chengkuizengella sp. 2205SS18-9]MDP5276735.1 DUF4489 domain-containing protein [Chengkuizengella sp. 2205SS18-9]
MGNKYRHPFIKSGKVFQPVLPLQLSQDDPLVALTQVSVNANEIDKPCILINFSGFMTTFLREERYGEFIFSLKRFCLNTSHSETLIEWPFTRAFVNDTNIKEPIVYNYCDCLSEKNGFYAYQFGLTYIKLSEKSSFNITKKSMTAQVYSDNEVL